MANASVIRRDVVPYITTSAYVTGDVIGQKSVSLTRPLELTRVTIGEEPGKWLQSVSILSKGTTLFDAEVWFFNSDPYNSTITDNAAFTLNDLDYDKVEQVIRLNDVDGDANTGTSVLRSNDRLRPFRINPVGRLDIKTREEYDEDPVTTLYAVIVSRGAVTYAAAGDITLRVHILSS